MPTDIYKSSFKNCTDPTSVKHFIQGIPFLFQLQVYKEKEYRIAVQTQLYLCINQLHVSAIYSHHQAEYRTINNFLVLYST